MGRGLGEKGVAVVGLGAKMGTVLRTPLFCEISLSLLMASSLKVLAEGDGINPSLLCVKGSDEIGVWVLTIKNGDGVMGLPGTAATAFVGNAVELTEKKRYT